MIIEKERFVEAGNALSELAMDLPPGVAKQIGKVAQTLRSAPRDLNCATDPKSLSALSFAVHYCFGFCQTLSDPNNSEISLGNSRIAPGLFRSGAAQRNLELATENFRILRLLLDFPELAEESR